MSRRTRRAAPWYRKYWLAIAGGAASLYRHSQLGGIGCISGGSARWVMNSLVLAALGCGAYLTGLLAGRRHRRHGLRNGGLLGVLLGICVLGISTACTGHVPHLHALVRLVWMAVCGGAGGVQGVNQKQPGVPEE